MSYSTYLCVNTSCKYISEVQVTTGSSDLHTLRAHFNTEKTPVEYFVCQLRCMDSASKLAGPVMICFRHHCPDVLFGPKLTLADKNTCILIAHLNYCGCKFGERSDPLHRFLLGNVPQCPSHPPPPPPTYRCTRFEFVSMQLTKAGSGPSEGNTYR